MGVHVGTGMRVGVGVRVGGLVGSVGGATTGSAVSVGVGSVAVFVGYSTIPALPGFRNFVGGTVGAAVWQLEIINAMNSKIT